jgi:hypothetical protein
MLLKPAKARKNLFWGWLTINSIFASHNLKQTKNEIATYYFYTPSV